MTCSDLQFLTLAAAADLIRCGELSPVEYVRALIARIEAVDAQVHAVITPTFERALEAARHAEGEIVKGAYRGPLHGIPFGLKDVFDTAGVRTTGGSRLFLENVPSANAPSVDRMLDAGALLLGKVATHEFASGGPSLDLPWPPARNPWNTAYFTGGSSSGPGAAVAAGMMPVALGSDTGGSIRIPAAFCGLAGIKPTYGLVSRKGVMPNSYTFDHVGPLAWTVEDCAIVLQVIAQRPVPDYRAALDGDLRGLRIGVVRHFWEEEGATDPEMAQAMERAIEVLRSLGARVADARMRPRRPYSDTMMVIGKTETAAIYVDALRTHPADFGSDFVARTVPGLFFSGEDYVRAQRERRRLIDEMAPLYERHDVLVTATSAPAPRLEKVIGAGAAIRWKDASIYTPFNVTGGPALVLCNGYTASGLPLAMQIAGRPFGETSVFRVGHAYEMATGWRARRPRLVPGAAVPGLGGAAPEAAVDVDPRSQEIVDAALARAGLALDVPRRRQLYDVALPALDAAQRIRGDHGLADEPASTFCFSAPGSPNA